MIGNPGRCDGCGRSVSAARPIPLDENFVEELLRFLEKNLPRALTREHGLSPDEQIGIRSPIMWFERSFEDFLGRTHDLKILVRSVRGRYNEPVSGAGAGVVDGSPGIVIQLSSSLTPREIRERFARNGKFRRRVRQALKHELTHVADPAVELEGEGPSDIRGIGEVGDEYFGDPAEVRAYMAEIIDEVQGLLDRDPSLREKSPREMMEWVKFILRGNSTWRVLQDRMPKKGLDRIRKAIYTTLRDNSNRTSGFRREGGYRGRPSSCPSCAPPRR